MNKDVFTRLILIMILITGLFFIYNGYSEYFSYFKNTKNYATTDGYFMKYDMDSSTNPVTYTLTYSYVVDKHTYFIVSKNKVTKLPALGTQTKVKYSVENPETGIVMDSSLNSKYIIIGLIFMIISIIGFTNRFLNRYNKFYKTLGIISGILTILIGVYIYYLYSIISSTSAIIDIWNLIGFLTLVPVLLVIVGIIVIILIVFYKKEDEIV